MSDRPPLTISETSRVLVVGTSERIAEATSALARSFSSPSLLLASTTTGALDRLERSAVDCVVCDLREVDALQTVDALHSVDRRVPVVALVDRGDAREALDAGVSDVFFPNDSSAVVVTRVRNAVDRAQLQSQSDDQQYRSILEHSGSLVFVLDEDGGLQYTSPAVETVTGHTPDEVGRGGPLRFVHPDDREDVLEVFTEIVEARLGSTRRVTCRIAQADGTWQVAAVRFTNRLGDPAIDGIVVTVPSPSQATPLSVDDRDTLERIAYPFFALDTEWVFTDANDAAGRLFDRSREELVGTVVWELLPESVRGSFYDRFHEAVSTGSVVEFDRLYPPTETLLEIHVHPSETGVSVYIREASPDTGGVSDADRRSSTDDEMRVDTSTTAPGPTATPDPESTPVSGHGSDSRPDVGTDAGTDTDADTDAEPDTNTTTRVRTDRGRASLFEAVVDSLEEGVFVLDGRTIDLANTTMTAFGDGDPLVGRDLDSIFDTDTADRILERADSAVVRRLDPIESSLERHGERRPVAISVAPLPGDDRVVCVVREEADRVDSLATQTRVQEAFQAFLEATTVPEICRLLGDAVVDVLHGEVGCVYLAGENAFEPATLVTPDSDVTADLPTIGFGDSVFDGVLEREAVLVEPSSDVELGDLLSRIGVRGEYTLIAPIGSSGIVLSTARRSFSDAAVSLVDSLTTGAALALVSVEHESIRRTRERELSRTQAELDRLEGLTDRKRRIERRSIRAESRSALERLVCEELVAMDRLEFAWIGSVDGGTETVTSRAWAGTHETYLDDVSVTVDDHGEPTGRTVASRSVTLVDRVADEPDLEWVRSALDHGFGSALSVPLLYDEYCYGVLSMYASRPSAFDELARSAFTELGETVAFVINALETKQALLSEGVTQLEFVMREGEDLLSTLSRRTDTRVTLESVVPRSNDRSTLFVTVSDAAATTVLSVGEEHDDVDSIRLVADRDGESLLEIVTTSVLVSTLVDHAAVLRSVDVDGTRTRFVVELDQGADVRAFVDMLERKFPAVSLVARRECDRPTQTHLDFRSALRERLTERQLRALETAYVSGFFEWPRERTGEEIAHSLGISQPTFNRHFRTAERKLFTMLFDDE